MAVKRLWFPNSPASIDVDQRSQLSVGYPRLAGPVIVSTDLTRVLLNTRVQNFLNCPVYWTVDDLNDSAQDGIDEVCAFTGCILKSAEITFQQNLTYYDLLTLLPDYVGVISIWNKTTKRWMIPTSTLKLDADRVDWETAFGVPYYFVPINHRYIAIYKKPANTGYGTMYMFYIASAPTLDDNTVINNIIPEDHTYALESYVITDLLEMQQEYSKADKMFQSYLSNTEELRVLIKNRRNIARQPSLR